MTLLTSGGKLVYPFVLHTPENQALFEECCCGQPGCTTCPAGTPFTPGMPPSTFPVVDTLFLRITTYGDSHCNCLDGLCIPLHWYGNRLAGNGYGDGSWQGHIRLYLCHIDPLFPDGGTAGERYLIFNLSCCSVKPNCQWRLSNSGCITEIASHPIVYRDTSCPPIDCKIYDANPYLYPVGAYPFQNQNNQSIDNGWSCRPYDMTITQCKVAICCGHPIGEPHIVSVHITENPC